MELEADIPLLVQCANLPFSEILVGLQYPQRVVGFDGLFLKTSKALSLVRGPQTEHKAQQKVENFWASLGLLSSWITESPALVLPRIICQLVNEAAFALQEGVGDAETIDKAMQLGVNYPKGLIEWGQEIGYAKVLSVLDHLYEEFHEERYRACILLRRWARQETRV